MVHADEGDVVDLMGHVLQPGDGCLELAGQIGVLGVAEQPSGDVGNGGRDVEDLVLGDPGQRRAEHDPWGVARGLDGGQADLLDPPPDLRDILDVHPVQLDVLPVGQVGGVPGELAGDLAQYAELLGGQRTTVDPNPHHEAVVLEVLRCDRPDAAAGDPGLALVYMPHQRKRLRRSVRSTPAMPVPLYTSSMRRRTFSPSSSCLMRSLSLSGWRSPAAHCPSERTFR